MTDAAHPREAPTEDNPGGAAEIKRAATRSVTPRHAASLILWRQGPHGPEVLMGLRHAGHRFMPNVLVFPGGRVDRADYRAKALSELPDFHPRLPGTPGAALPRARRRHRRGAGVA